MAVFELPVITTEIFLVKTGTKPNVFVSSPSNSPINIAGHLGHGHHRILAHVLGKFLGLFGAAEEGILDRFGGIKRRIGALVLLHHVINVFDIHQEVNVRITLDHVVQEAAAIQALH